mmetsp:Transcript_9116/g.21890  ORF Transcript_9116/g.21890 Transcript_9116/m.21890 type:complete len:93 (-) Transcript_9116:48-326(-)
MISDYFECKQEDLYFLDNPCWNFQSDYDVFSQYTEEECKAECDSSEKCTGLSRIRDHCALWYGNSCDIDQSNEYVWYENDHAWSEPCNVKRP